MKTVLPALLGMLAGAISCAPALGATTRTQTIELRAGWNAVFLEVQPEAARPSRLFASLPVTTVACFIPARLDAGYLRHPGDAPWRDEGWLVWHAPSGPDAFLSNLEEVQAQRPLLILAESSCTWTVTGEARTTIIEWHPDTCTFTGLPVDPAAPPTFAAFFAGSPAHHRRRIFRLEADVWKLVRDPARETIRGGEAYWIETDGGSDFQGPLHVSASSDGELDFGAHLAHRTLRFHNASPLPARIRIETYSGSDSLPLRAARRNLSTLATEHVALPGSLELPVLAPGERTVMRLEPDRAAMQSAEGRTLLRITDGRGTQHWVPVLATRADLAAASARP